jgi:hypothetical protein
VQVHFQESPLPGRRHNTEKTRAWKLLRRPSRESRRNPSPRDHPMITDERFSRQPAVCIRTLSHVASAPNPSAVYQPRAVGPTSPAPSAATNAHHLTVRCKTLKGHNRQVPHTLFRNCVEAAPPPTHTSALLWGTTRRLSRYPTHHTHSNVEAIRCSCIASMLIPVPHVDPPPAQAPGDNGAYRWRSRCNTGETEHMDPYTAPRAACAV